MHWGELKEEGKKLPLVLLHDTSRADDRMKSANSGQFHDFMSSRVQ